MFLEYAFDFHLCLPVIQTYQALLNKFIKHDTIPDDDAILGRCFLLLSYLLQPLAVFQKQTICDPLDPEYDSADVQVVFNEKLPKIIQSISDQVLGGVLYKDHGNAITSEFISVVESNPDKFINKMGALAKYIKILEIDVRNLKILNNLKEL